jgi:hypothetical protein
MIHLLLAAAAALPSAGDPSSITVDESVVITSVSAEPAFASGVLATAVKVTGTVDGQAKDYFIFFHRFGQPRPSVGARCRIASERFSFNVLFVGPPNSAAGGQAVHSFDCGGGTYSTR